MNLPAQSPILLFLHVHKTGGTTLRSIIDKQYPAAQCLYLYGKEARLSEPGVIPRQLIPRLRCIYGHYPFGIHRLLNRPFRYITMLRDPVDRVISLYHHVISNPTDSIHNQVKHMSLLEFVQADKPEYNNSNLQTRMMAGSESPDLQQAKANIRRYFEVVGISERFDESLQLMKLKLGWQNVSYSRINETDRRLKAKVVPAEVRQLIAVRNGIDMQLYRFACQLLDEQLAKAGIRR